MRRLKSKYGVEYDVYNDGSVRFDDGVFFSPDEMKKLKGVKSEIKENIYRIKKKFGNRYVWKVVE